MAVQAEMYSSIIAETLFPATTFVNYATDGDGFVNEDGTKIHLPQSGAEGDVAWNPTNFPLPFTGRTDDDLEIPLDVLAVLPRRVGWAESQEVVYDKLASIMGQNIATLQERIAKYVAYKWAATQAGHILRTTGDAVPATLKTVQPNGTVTGATGNRKGLTTDDLEKAMLLMDNYSVPSDGRYGLIPSYMLQPLYKRLLGVTNTNAEAFNILVGKIEQLYNFKLLNRTHTVSYNAAGTTPNNLSLPAAAIAANDNNAAMFWHPALVFRAKGAVKTFVDVDGALTQGTVISHAVRLMAGKLRKDGVGVISIVEDASA